MFSPIQAQIFLNTVKSNPMPISPNSKLKGQHFKRKKKGVKNCVFNQKSQISEIFPQIS